MSRFALALFVVALGIDLGAGLYEARVVVPLWSNGVPATLAAGDPFGQVAIDAGMHFWAVVTPITGLLALVVLAFMWSAPQPLRTWCIAASVLELCVLASTLLYFRPTLVRLFMGHGAGLSTTAIVTTVGQWVRWSYLRVAVSLVAWAAAIVALALS